MRQYVNEQASGNIGHTFRNEVGMEQLAERVMAIARRLVECEDVVLAEREKSRKLELEVEALTKKVENLTLRSEGKEFKKPTTSRAKKTVAIKSTDE